MSKFDTHGGYFAPKDYMRVNEGGSHEENPNGGVQIGVDPEGNPNLLEEGEPVYKDYVYSDNIEAEEKFLVDNNLPKKYAGKLYSKIADDLFSEAEERPLDPISRNGLEVLLGRLAEAQEGQKQAKDEAELRNRLSQLSPEELGQLEETLVQQGIGEPASVPEEEMMTPDGYGVPQGMPTMRCGGNMSRAGRKFTTGGDIPPGTLLFNPETARAYNPELGGPNDTIPMLIDEEGNLVDYIDPSVSVAFPGKTQAWVDAQVGPNSIRKQVSDAGDQFLNTAWDMGRANMALQLTPVGSMMSALDLGPAIAEGDDAKRIAWDVVDSAPIGVKALKATGMLGPVTRGVKRVVEPVARGIWRGIKDGVEGVGKWAAKGIKERNLMVSEAVDGFKKAVTDAKSALAHADEISNELNTVNDALKVYPDDVELLKYKEELESAAKMADKAARSTYGKVITSGGDVANKSLGWVTGPLRKHGDYNKEVEAARKIYEEAKAAAEAHPRSKKLKEAFEAAASELEKTESFGHKWMQKGSPWMWKLPIGIAGGATGLILENQKEKDDWANDQYADGGKMNLFATGGPYEDDPTFPYGLDTLLYNGLTDSSVDVDFPLSPQGAAEKLAEEARLREMAALAANNAGSGTSGSRLSGTSGVSSSSIPFDRSINGEDFEAQEYYKNFLAHMQAIKDSEEAKQWMQYIQDEIAKSGSKYKLKDYDDWYWLATDKRVGPVHKATEKVAKELARRRQMRANQVLLGNTPGVSRLGAVDPNAIGPNYGPYGNLMLQVAPSQALAAKALSRRAMAAGAMGVVNPNAALAASMMLQYPGTQTNGANDSTGGENTQPGNTQANTGQNESYSPSALPTWPRYAGAIGSGLLGLYDVFQQPDKYTAARITPHTPEGRIHFQNQVYNPIDQNMIMNAQIAQGNATRRALQNSGMGPSTGAAILAADNNLTGNLGTGFIQAWDANNQRRNAVIAANNQAEAQRAQFDANMDYYRTDALNKAAMYNAQNDLTIQRLNNEAEGQKYQAISNQIANGLQALSGIGQENFAMNQINSNPANLGYRVGPNGLMFYNPSTRKWEDIKK